MRKRGRRATQQKNKSGRSAPCALRPDAREKKAGPIGFARLVKAFSAVEPSATRAKRATMSIV